MPPVPYGITYGLGAWRRAADRFFAGGISAPEEAFGLYEQWIKVWADNRPAPEEDPYKIWGWFHPGALPPDTKIVGYSAGGPRFRQISWPSIYGYGRCLRASPAISYDCGLFFPDGGEDEKGPTGAMFEPQDTGAGLMNLSTLLMGPRSDEVINGITLRQSGMPKDVTLKSGAAIIATIICIIALWENGRFTWFRRLGRGPSGLIPGERLAQTGCHAHGDSLLVLRRLSLTIKESVEMIRRGPPGG